MVAASAFGLYRFCPLVASLHLTKASGKACKQFSLPELLLVSLQKPQRLNCAVFVRAFCHLIFVCLFIAS